jgi:hypothetical protein
MASVRLSIEALGVLRQVLGQIAPTPDGNVMKLREKLYGPLDGTAVLLTREEVQFFRDTLKGMVAIDDDDRPLPRPTFHKQLIAKLTRALVTKGGA